MWGQRRVLRALEALKKASEELLLFLLKQEEDQQPHDSPSMRALLELESKSQHLLYGDPDLSRLSLLLSRLRTLSQSPPTRIRGRGRKGGVTALPFPFPFPFPFSSHSDSAINNISSTVASISSEIQAWIDRESLHHLSAAFFRSNLDDDDEDELLELLASVESRLAEGFDQGLQSALLRSGLFQALESALTGTAASKRVKDSCASAVAAVVRFNRDVFVSRVMVGSSLRSLVAMATPATMRALHALVSAIGTPLVDVLDSQGEIPRVVGLLREGSEHAEVAAVAVEVVMEIGFYGRKEAVDGMVKSNVVERLLALQRAHHPIGEEEEADEEERGVRAGGVLVVVGSSVDGWRPTVEDCVARFALRVDLGEGIRKREKRELRLELMRRVRAVTSDAEAADMIAEVLWGTAP